MENTLARVRERFYWLGYHSDASNWCRTCSLCSSCKNPVPKLRAPLKSIKTGYPQQIVAVDIMGPFPRSNKGNTYILVASDYFTRWV